MVLCCIPFCGNRRRKTSGISYHEFPSDEELRKKWLKVIGPTQYSLNFYSTSAVVCSEHFTPDDFKDSKIRALHRGSVPSIFPSCRPRNVVARATQRWQFVMKFSPTANKRHSSGPSQDGDQSEHSSARYGDIVNNTDLTVTEIKEELDAACCWMDSETPQFTDFSPIIKKEMFADGFVKHEDQMNMDKVILKPGCANIAIEHRVISDIKDEEHEEKWLPYFPPEEVTVDEFNLDAVKVEPETDDKLVSFDDIHPSLLKEEQEKSPCHSPEKQHELSFLDGPSDIYGHGTEYTTHSDSEKRPKIVGGIERRKSVQNSVQSFICPHCCLSFQSEVLLSQHTQIHTAVELCATGPKEAAPDRRKQTMKHRYFVQDLVRKGEGPISSKDKELELLQKKYERLVAKNEKLNKEILKQCEEIKLYESKLKRLESRPVAAKSRKRKNIVL